MGKKVDIEKNKQRYLDFMASRQTVILNMQDYEGLPFSSCAPFVKYDNKLYIYISEVAEHYHFLEHSEVVDALLIADEADTKNGFATERVRLRCKPKNLGNDNVEPIFDLLNEAHGKTMVDMLRGLDFAVFELTPEQGRYVIGFGMAFDTDITGDTFSHVVVDKKNKGGK